MDLRQLRYFLGVVERGSIAKAADELHVAQSAISLQLNKLERELGCALLHRTSRGIVPTENGMLLAGRARSVLHDVDAIPEEVRGVEAAPAGKVVVGMPTSLGIALTVPLALAVRRTFPLVRLRIAEGLSGHMSQWLSAGFLDFALVFGSESISGISKELVGREHLHLVGEENAELFATAGDVPASEVFKLPLILPGRPHGLREEVERAADREGFKLNIILEIDSLENIKALVAEGLGYTVSSQRVAKYGSAHGRLKYRVIGTPAIERSIYLARSSNMPLTIAARSVAALLSSIFPQWQHLGTGEEQWSSNASKDNSTSSEPPDS
jgi:LysR family nitrogen assimilation transcriptional regulator